MRRVSDAINSIIAGNALLQMGLSHRLFNLTQLAKHIQPQVEAWTKKELQSSAILMQLSRLQRKFEDQGPFDDLEIYIDNLIIRSELVTLTYLKTKEIHRSINSLHNKIETKGGYLTLSQGINEVTLIFEKEHLELARSFIAQKPIYRHENIASIGVKLTKRYLETPGFFYLMFQQLYFQNINIIEIASTATELIFYVEQDDVRLAFDTLYNRFAKRRAKKRLD